MKTKRIFVTGSGSCGSTFLMRLFHELGYDLGDDLNSDLERPRGLEHRPLAQLLADLEMEFSPVPLPPYGVEFNPQRLREPDMSDFLEAMRGEGAVREYNYRVAWLSINLPLVVKAPTLNHWLRYWLLAGGVRPDLVVHCSRGVEESVRSFQRDALGPADESLFQSWTYLREGIFHNTVRRYGLKVKEVRFPESVRGVHTSGLSSLFWEHPIRELQEAHERAAKPDLVHV